MRYFGPMMLTVAIASILMTSVVGAVEYWRSLQDCPSMIENGVERPLTFAERFDAFAWEPSLDALAPVIIISSGITATALPVGLLVAHRPAGLAYGCSGLVGAVLGCVIMPVVAYVVFGRWNRPTTDWAWAFPLVGGAVCGILLTAMVRTMASAKPGNQTA